MSLTTKFREAAIEQSLGHAFATHAMRAGNDIKTVQSLLGHEDLNTTAIYLHADAARGFSPLDVRLIPRREVIA